MMAKQKGLSCVYMVNMCVCVGGLGVKVVECHMLIECLLDNKAREGKCSGNH